MESVQGLHGQQTGLMLEKIEECLLKYKPDMVLVYGDTILNSYGSSCSSLRSFDRSMHEEVNRVLTDKIASLLFCPTKVSVNQLKKEGITDGVFITGDIMVDVLYNAIPILALKI